MTLAAVHRKTLAAVHRPSGLRCTAANVPRWPTQQGKGGKWRGRWGVVADGNGSESESEGEAGEEEEEAEESGLGKSRLTLSRLTPVAMFAPKR